MLATAGAAEQRPMRLTGAVGRVFAETSPTALDPALRPYLADLVAPHGNALREDLLDAGAGHSFGEMAEALLPAAVAPDEPVDLLVLAYALHDLRLGRATACYLSSRCPGAPMAFAVCDQGRAAPFTALRLIQAYSGVCARALLVVVEQSALHYVPRGDAPVPDQHTAVVLRFEAGEGPGVRTRVSRSAELALSGDAVIVGATLAERAPGHAVVAEAGRPFTGPWWELSQRERSGRVVVADHEPALGYTCEAAIECGVPA
ncbi:hypothetical protein [Actinokineospora sp. NPDC004072]